MNFFTSSRAVSLFPRTTFVLYKFIKSSQRDFLSNGETYVSPIVHEAEGYDHLRDDDISTEETTTLRRVGDERCWIIPLKVSSEYYSGTTNKRPCIYNINSSNKFTEHSGIRGPYVRVNS